MATHNWMAYSSEGSAVYTVALILGLGYNLRPSIFAIEMDTYAVKHTINMYLE
jgi:hypothetical protein